MPFSGNPVLEMLPGDWWALKEPFWYEAKSGCKIEVPVGFETDLASVPWGLWNILPKDGDYAPAAIIHDWLYTSHDLCGKPCERAAADDILLEGMEELGIGRVRRYIIWAAVRVGGSHAWSKER
jgi:hypothetical protein